MRRIVLRAVFVTLSLGLLIFWVGNGGVAAGLWSESAATKANSSITWLVVGASVSGQLLLFAAYRRRRPLDRVDRTYYRLGIAVLAVMSVYSQAFYAFAPAVVLLLHSYAIDRDVVDVEGTVPVTKRDREELTGERPMKRRRGRR